MYTTSRLTISAVALLAGLSFAHAQTAKDRDERNSDTTGPAKPMGPPAGKSGGMGMGPGGMMGKGPSGGQGSQQGMMGGDMAQMMKMMHAERMGMGMPGAGGLAHIEGQLAYVKAELAITDAQSGPWNKFADTIRAQAARMRQAGGMQPQGTPSQGGMPSQGMPPQGMQPQGTAPQGMGAVPGMGGPGMGAFSAPDMIERRITMMTAGLDAMKAVQTAMRPLYDVLSPDQKKTADGLMAEHFMSMHRAGR